MTVSKTTYYFMPQKAVSQQKAIFFPIRTNCQQTQFRCYPKNYYRWNYRPPATSNKKKGINSNKEQFKS